MQDIYMSIGQSIRRRRKEKHLTQETLATNVETSAQYRARTGLSFSRISISTVCRTGMPYLFLAAIHRTQRFYQFLFSGTCKPTQ